MGITSLMYVAYENLPNENPQKASAGRIQISKCLKASKPWYNS